MYLIKKQQPFLSCTLQGPLTLQPFYSRYFPRIFSCQRSGVILWFFCFLLSCFL